MSWDRSKGRPEPIRALNRVHEVDNGEPLVALSEVSPSVKILRTSVIPYLRQTVAEMLEQAAHNLPDGLFLGVVDAWRPFDRQVKIYEMMWRFLHEARPDVSYATARRMVCRFVAPVDQKAPPGHCTGAAVDVHLVDAEGKTVDVTSPLERLQGAPTFAYGLTDEARANRMLMVEAMLEAGFSNCRDEWWHYSYGDAGWAVRSGLDACLYGKIDLLPESLYEEQVKEWEESARRRPNPFLSPSSSPAQAKS
ncbi:MAG: hypothetical protein JSS65_06385 [Armatimonadetes bacterium]|nr:hypothetical protein [Armatimonadota bacterium]